MLTLYLYINIIWAEIVIQFCLYFYIQWNEGWRSREVGGPNTIGHTGVSDDRQTTISSSAQSPDAANSSTDAEC